MKTVIMDHIMDAGFELQYKVAADFACFLSVYRQLHCISSVTVAGSSDP